MSVYLIADIEVRDAKTYGEYVHRARPLIEEYGGAYRVQGGEPISISGEWTPERIVMIEFPSKDALERCFASERYKTIAPLRERSTTSRAVVARACDGKDGER